ncbi:MAG: hypothetical protein OJF51_004012 [Nitrospira sp.]|nr:MAG: hypothetical protein OJF51_004012 [Nitrospira sp.]
MGPHAMTKQALRRFGLMVRGIFLLIGLWSLVWHPELIRP